ncbi:methyltransferase domain-containing protein [Paenibacillus macquariensis]|uniref:Glycosyltransferase, GT2 family n=1 Tax=Paenibacillus macquariensis TaxID=948756 RepID=A0ABY1K6S2_9BACL|nr:methyltransferase domain-containing protein [Paenibacillus macquariensis]MEC0093645.1 methyltransferase domain-containing protein [Paenibacillus macquariensis]SIR33956.1 Glycosyltransferase, GT2 family [Paenibacillus macquariensis]
MKTSIIILTHNQLEFTIGCIESIRKFTRLGTYEIIVVDNKSTDGTREWLSNQHELLTIFNDENLGFPKGCNQGIEISSGEYILLLNNDIVVTKNWLENLTNCIESSDNIGAVGPITNNSTYHQSIEVDYHTDVEMHAFAESINISNPEKWEKRLRLIGFCMLIKREVVDKIGFLDEIFSPGNFEDDDYSYRIIQEGYHLVLCRDTFIHHYGSVSFKEKPQAYNELLQRNRQKFIEKWSFDSPSSSFMRYDIVKLMDEHNKEASLNVLEIGCGCGATLLLIKNLYKNARLYGIENNKNAASIASLFADVISADVEKLLDYPNELFEYIILTDVVEHLYNPLQVLKDLKKHLKPNGKILASIPNVMHYSVLRDVINGRWNSTDAGLLDRTPLRLFTLDEVNKMFKEAEYDNISYNVNVTAMNKEDEQWIQKLNELSNLQDETQFKVYQYLVKASKTIIDREKAIKMELNEYNRVSELLQEIDKSVNLVENSQQLIDELQENKFTINEVFMIISDEIGNKIDVLNFLAVSAFNEGSYDFIIPFLQKALEYDPLDKGTLKNLGEVLDLFGETEMALEYVSKIEDQSQDILELIEKLKISNESKKSISEEILSIEQNDVPFTGERLVINQQVKNNFNDVLEEHMVRYELACKYVKGKLVLDAACGAGYGSKMLQKAGASFVIGVDVDEESLENARGVYAADNISFRYGDVNGLSLEDKSVDVVVSFETIEHIDKGSEWIKESARVLKDDGIFLVSTPNRMVTNPGLYYEEQPLNPHHRFEYGIIEFIGELLKEYELLELYGQSYIQDNVSYYNQVMRQARGINSEFLPSQILQQENHALLSLGEVKDAQPMYVVAVCKKKKNITDET